MSRKSVVRKSSSLLLNSSRKWCWVLDETILKLFYAIDLQNVDYLSEIRSDVFIAKRKRRLINMTDVTCQSISM